MNSLKLIEELLQDIDSEKRLESIFKKHGFTISEHELSLQCSSSFREKLDPTNKNFADSDMIVLLPKNDAAVDCGSAFWKYLNYSIN